LRDHRAGIDADHTDVQTKIGERLFEERGLLPQLLVVLLIREWRRIAEQRERWQFVVGEAFFVEHHRRRPNDRWRFARRRLARQSTGHGAVDMTNRIWSFAGPWFSSCRSFDGAPDFESFSADGCGATDYEERTSHHWLKEPADDNPCGAEPPEQHEIRR